MTQNKDLAGLLSDAAGAAFVALGLEASLGAVRRSDRPDLADFQCNGAMAGAKKLGKNPREIATSVVDALKGSSLVAGCEVAGPGFINIKLSADGLNKRAAEIAADERSGAWTVETPRRVVMDFGGWNVAKEMHIGHLRSTVIGDSLQRLFRFMGDSVTSDVHLGDWGLQMGQLINEVKLEQPGLPYFDASFTGPYPEQSPVTMDDLGRLYPLASGKSKTDEARRNEDRAATQELQSGRPGYRALWKHFCNVTRVGLERECKSLGVTFDLWKGESDAEPFIPQIVDDLKSRGISEFDQGAWIVRVARESDKKEMPPIILVNRDGAIGYHGSDLGTIVDRKQSIDPQLSLYIVDQRQALHFEQVFRASDRAGYLPEKELEHLGFGTVNGPDGKPFKTRDGGTLKLQAFIAQADEVATARMKEAELGSDVSEAEQQDIAHKVAVAAIKFSDLSNVRTTNYIFDLERFVSFEGKTGPYLLYAAVRVKSLARRAAAEGVKAGPITVELDAERALVLALDGFNDALRGAYEKRMPHILCEHAYALGQAFSGFYAAAPILVESDPVKKASRLALALATLKQLEIVLGLIGIDVPDRM
ncbi:MAG TPA: arginine--tRNA ligase [Hyphomonadaceae bacterium]|mgnify:CR=1 FL=1|nr:arginine--tRNA ligase [Hyphomonadaceae bacterium]HPN04471.1 arginine--tRNA ligase [Hyphomonadaceae bacterium]